jgi:hypothetical protein
MKYSAIKNSSLYLLLLIAPFLNIINHKFSSTISVSIILFIMLVSSLRLFRFKLYKEQLFFAIVVLNFFIIVASIFLSYRVGNISIVVFFTTFSFLYLFYSGTYNLYSFLDKYYVTLLKYYIVIIFLSVFVDYFILHFMQDLTLQLMYDKEALSYHTRPHGITGQPSVNATLVIFFYALLISTKDDKHLGFFFLTSATILLQASGVGFIVYAFLLYSMAKKTKHKYLVYFFSILFLSTLILTNNIPSKISLTYFKSFFQVFLNQLSSANSSIQAPIDLLLGGWRAGIDFTPIFLTANMGLIFLLLILSLFVYLIFKTKLYYERAAIVIILIGSMHYPVIFYTLSSFFLPLLIFKIINHKHYAL